MLTLWMLNIELGTASNSHWQTGSYYLMPNVIKSMREYKQISKNGNIIIPEDCSHSSW